MSWYAAKMGNDHQGLVIDEQTGKNIAVTYEKVHAPLIAASPDLLATAEAYVECVRVCVNHGFHGAHFDHMALADGALRAVIAKAKGI